MLQRPLSTHSGHVRFDPLRTYATSAMCLYHVATKSHRVDAVGWRLAVEHGGAGRVRNGAVHWRLLDWLACPASLTTTGQGRANVRFPPLAVTRTR
jgi:hypothetical protein